MPKMGPEVPDVEEVSSSGVDHSLSAFGTRLTQDYDKVAKGDVVFENLKNVTSDWVPDDPAAVRFRDTSVNGLNRLLNNTPDFDTGWFYVENGGNWYDIEHRIGAVPKRTLIYWSDVKEPKAGNDSIVEMSSAFHIYQNLLGQLLRYGVWLFHNVDGKKSQIVTADDYVFGWGDTGRTGYLRVLVWR